MLVPIGIEETEGIINSEVLEVQQRIWMVFLDQVNESKWNEKSDYTNIVTHTCQ